MIEKRENGMREKPWQCQIRDDIEHYLPSQDEIRLMEDILNLTGVILIVNPDGRTYRKHIAVFLQDTLP